MHAGNFLSSTSVEFDLDQLQMLCRIGKTECPLSVKKYSTRGGISLYWTLCTKPSLISSFNISANTASDIVVNSFFN